MINQQIERLLPLVNKPGRYVGGEMNSVIKEKREGLLRFAFCFPIPMRWACPIWG